MGTEGLAIFFIFHGQESHFPNIHIIHPHWFSSQKICRDSGTNSGHCDRGSCPGTEWHVLPTLPPTVLLALYHQVRSALPSPSLRYGSFFGSPILSRWGCQASLPSSEGLRRSIARMCTTKHLVVVSISFQNPSFKLINRPSQTASEKSEALPPSDSLNQTPLWCLQGSCLGRRSAFATSQNDDTRLSQHNHYIR